MDAGRPPTTFPFRRAERRQESPRGDKGKLALAALRRSATSALQPEPAVFRRSAVNFRLPSVPTLFSRRFHSLSFVTSAVTWQSLDLWHLDVPLRQRPNAIPAAASDFH